MMKMTDSNEINCNDLSTFLLNEAKKNIKNGDLQQAKLRLLQAESLNPNNQLVLSYLALTMAYSEPQQPSTALRLINNALNCDPDNPEVLICAGYIFSRIST